MSIQRTSFASQGLWSPKNTSNSMVMLREFPQDELYRLLIDENLVNTESGWRKYEDREPGCIAALCKAAEIAWFHEIENKNLNMSLIKKLHLQVTTDVQKLNSMDFTPGEFRKSFTGFTIASYDENVRSSVEGIYDILQLIWRQFCAAYDSKENQQKTFEDYNYIVANSKHPEERKAFSSTRSVLGMTGSALVIDNKNICYAVPHSYNTNSMEQAFEEILGAKHKQLSINEKIKALAEFLYDNDQYFGLRYRVPAPHIVPLETEKLIQSYNLRIKDAAKDEEKIAIIAETICELNRVHSFRDANIRVFIILLGNRLLIQNNLGPAIFSDPNVFDRYGKKELAAILQEANDRCKNRIKQLKSGEAAFKTQTIPEKERDQFKEWSKDLYNLIQNEAKLSPRKLNAMNGLYTSYT